MRNRLDRFIAYLSPRAGLARDINRARATRLYEAAQSSSKMPAPRGQGLSADATLWGAGAKVRGWARHLDENHDLAAGILSALENGIVGAGIAMEPRPIRVDGQVDESFARQIDEEWEAWAESADVTGELAYQDCLALIVRSWARDGEMFIHHLPAGNNGFRRRPGVAPYACELLEADMVPLDLVADGPGKLRTVHGISRTGFGAPAVYRVYKQHPGEFLGPGYGVVTLEDTVGVPAEFIDHVRLCQRIGQTRGVSIFASVVARLAGVKDYEQSELIAARIAANMAAFIKRSPDIEGSVDIGTDSDGNAQRDFEFEAGMVFDGLLPGEDIGTISSDRPNTALGDFRQSQLRAVAAGTQSSASTISKSYDGTYSAQRQELSETYVSYRKLGNYILRKAAVPIYRRWFESSLISGVLKIPQGMTRRGAMRVVGRLPQVPWIDPLKEQQAEQVALTIGTTSRPAAIRRRGDSPRVITEELNADDWTPTPADTPDTGGQDDETNDSDGKATNPALAED